MDDAREALSSIKERVNKDAATYSSLEWEAHLERVYDQFDRLAEALDLSLNLAEELDKMARRIESNLPNFGADKRGRAEAFRESAAAIRGVLSVGLNKKED